MVSTSKNITVFINPVLAQQHPEKKMACDKMVKSICTKNIKVQILSPIKKASSALGLCRFGVLNNCHVRSSAGNYI